MSLDRHRPATLTAGLGILLATLALAGRQWLEGTMARHMLLQIPMLLGAGSSFAVAFASGWLPANRAATAKACTGKLRQWDENGIAGLSAFLLATAYWMIPRALDSAADSLSVDAYKVTVLLLAGLLLPGSLARANTIIQLFFVGNFPG